MDKIAQDAVNANFFQAMEQGGESARGVMEAATLYIKRRLREEAFCRKILNPQSLTKYEVQRDVATDTVYAVVDIEPKSSAMELNFRGEPTGHFFEADRYIVPFLKISTEQMEKSVSELYAYQMPVINIIQENQVKDVEEAEDVRFTNLCHTAVASTGKLIDDAGETQLTTLGMSKLFRLIDGDRLNTVAMLMNHETFNDVLAFESFTTGEDMKSKIFVDGYSYDKWLGKALIVTSKTNVVQENEVFAFTKQKYLGHFFILQSLQFFIQQVFDVIKWGSWEVIGMNFGNIKGIARYRFGTGVGNPTTVEVEASRP